ncbi:PadR family transcriptional regulator [Salipiger abyssi]|uniref:Putative transcriptional regulator n=1 Tax=Salipiger abyssi TaxID=1250539 RepID=A0A1P8UNA8_9RHOB|nr:PadR family transcriptional regulator [Salipiger abyssi]APZ50848.1 putative transcriptional regulator [Salipiger abyssi]
MSKPNATSSTAEPLRLSPVSYVVLGVIRLRGPSTSYDLKRAVGRSIQYFWPFPHSQLYVEPNRLAEAGLLSCEQEAEGRRRRLYALTEAGKDALDRWLGSGTEQVFELRDMALMQLFFSADLRPDQLRDLAEGQVRFHRQRIATLEEIAGNTGEFAGQNRMLPLDLGLRLARTYVDFWSDVAEERSG